MVDARGFACPIPVLMTQKELAKGPASLEVMVDNHAARENVTRLAESAGYTVAVKEDNGEYTLALTK